MGKLRDQLRRDLEIKSSSPQTQQTYMARVCEFVAHFNCSPKELGREEVSAYLQYLLCERKLSQACLNQTYSALKFFFETTLGQEWSAFRIPRAKLPKKLPTVLSMEEVLAVFAVTRNIKHRAVLMTMYSGGLRVREATHLRVTDIDSDRMQIRVDQGKGQKDRYTLLAQRTLVMLRDYCRYERPTEWLFPGQPPSQPSPKWLQHIPCGTVLPRIYWKRASICATSSSCWGIRACQPRPSICTRSAKTWRA